MLFPTFTFILAFLPITIIVYFLLSGRNTLFSKLWLITASFVFYAWFNWSYFFILAGSIVANYIIAEILYKNRKRFILFFGILFNILLLGYFKYYDFFVENINEVFHVSWPLKHILLPLGISFFTFQQISFLQQVYSGTLEKRYTFCNYCLFVCFFPQLVAGPIVLPDEMMSQFEKEENTRPDAQNISRGIYVFSLGLAKKILLADFFAVIADKVFTECSGNFITSWSGALAYMCQIYFDFSGYCDMAIGIALLFNIRLPVNFDAPYKSADISEFWRKWHITLGRFLMTSVYIPLGGNRHGKFRTCLNLLITFFISGLWHGASWLFVLWGVLHGLALIVNRVWSNFLGLKMHRIPARIITFLFVLLAWVLFRAADFAQATRLYKAMFLPSKIALPKHWEWHTLLLFAAGAVIVLFMRNTAELEQKFKPTLFNALVTIVFLVVPMFLFVKYSPFIYFNF